MSWHDPARALEPESDTALRNELRGLLGLPVPETSYFEAEATPELVSCAVPIIWISSQYSADASQKFTSPGVTGVESASTVAVSVTTLPDTTVVTALPAVVTARVVVVTVFVCAGALTAKTADHCCPAIS